MNESNQIYGMQKNTYLMLLHLSFFLGYIIPLLGWVAPIIMWQSKKEDADVDKHGKNLINFLLSYLIYAFVGFLLSIIGIGFVILGAIAVLQVVFVIMAALKANNGESWKYPLSIELIK